jgi:uncharacterized membrane protein YgaE (UPF0421/DUF939 family)
MTPLRVPAFRWAQVVRRPQAVPVSTAVRVAVQRTPVALTIVRHRAQPTAVTIIRLTSTAIFAYLLALVLTTTPRPVLAPLTALLVVRVSLYQTVRSAVTKVASVVAGVLLAVALSAWVGFTWWSLGIIIATGLAVGYALHLGDNILEVPISAMLILSVGTRSAAVGRVVETFVGTGAGLIAGFVLTSPQVETAEEAIGDLCGKLADLLSRMANELASGFAPRSAGEWLARARSLGGEIRRVDEALREAEESVKLNPRSVRLPLSTVTLRQSLETLEHETTTLRVLCRTLADCTRLAGDEDPLSDPGTCRELAATLRELSAAIKTYGSLATEHDVSSHQRLEAELERHLAAVREQQERLSERLRTDPAARPAGWPLRGELISHLDRLRNELQAGKPGSGARRRKPPWRRPPPMGSLLARRRLARRRPAK